MVTLVIRRIAHTAVLLALVAFASFWLSEWAPGRFDDALRLDPQYSSGAAAALRARHRLDEPVMTRFGAWVAALAQGSLGTSIEYDAPVAPLVLTRMGRTLLLGASATFLAWLVAVPLGIWMAASAGSRAERATAATTNVVLALPEPVLALGAVLLAARTGLLPAGGMRSVRVDVSPWGSWSGIADLCRHLALPALVLALGLMPTIVRHVRATMRSTLGSRFIVAARARGVPPGRLLFRAALRPAASPLLSLLGLSAANLMSVSLLVEVITGWPGLGPLLVEATRARDLPVVVASALCSAACLALGWLLSDIAVHLVDPRTRHAAAQAGVAP